MRQLSLLMLSLSIACTSSKGDSASEDAGDDTTEDTDDTSDTSDTDVTPPPSYFEPTSLVFAIEAPYANNEISSVNFGGTSLGGTLIVLLIDSENLTTTYYDPTYSCWLTFEFDNSMVADATSTATTDDGTAFVDAGGWLAWTIDSTAYVGKEGACDNVDPLGTWGSTIAAFEAGNYGFGFGTLTSDLETSLSENVDDWANEGKYHYAGYVGTDIIDGSFKYYDVNRGLAWDISGGDLEVNDDGTIANPQIDFTDAVFMTDNGYYSASPWFGWGFN